MSLGGPRTWPRACSGDINPGEPKPQPGMALAQAAQEIPKPITRGPSSVSRTLEGFTSRWTAPAAWMALRLSASPAASHSTLLTGSGPPLFTASASDGPSTYSVASHGSGPSGSASTTSAINGPLTFRAAATSWRNCARNSRSAASSTRMTFTATGCPSAEWPRNTRPMAPEPSCPDRRYGPIARGSSGSSGALTRSSLQASGDLFDCCISQCDLKAKLCSYIRDAGSACPVDPPPDAFVCRNPNGQWRS
jgi:hypothetical protein